MGLYYELTIKLNDRILFNCNVTEEEYLKLWFKDIYKYINDDITDIILKTSLYWDKYDIISNLIDEYGNKHLDIYLPTLVKIKYIENCQMIAITTSRKFTNIDTRALKDYLKELSRYDILSSDEEKELGRQIKDGNKTARDKLITHNLKFVITCAKHYQGKGLSLEDLIAEGSIGLIEAADRWDADKGYRFITYALWRIRQKLTKALTYKSRTVRIAQTASNIIYRIRVRTNEFMLKYKRVPTDEELAKACKCTIKELRTAMESKQEYLFLDSHVGNGDSNSSSFEEILPDNNGYNPEDIEDRTYIFIKILSNPVFSVLERNIILDYYGFMGDGKVSMKELGIKYDITTAKAWNLKRSAITKLKKHFSNILEELRCSYYK